MPCTKAVPGTMLSAVPAWIWVTEITSSCRPSWLRLTMVWIAWTSETAATIGSTVSCG